MTEIYKYPTRIILMGYLFITFTKSVVSERKYLEKKDGTWTAKISSCSVNFLFHFIFLAAYLIALILNGDLVEKGSKVNECRETMVCKCVTKTGPVRLCCTLPYHHSHQHLGAGRMQTSFCTPHWVSEDKCIQYMKCHKLLNLTIW